MNIKLLSINEADMSARATNALHRAGVHTVGDMLKYDSKTLSEISNLGTKSVSEILKKIEYYKEIVDEKPSVLSTTEIEPEDYKIVLDYLSENKVRTNALDLLPLSAYNYLMLSGYDKLEKFIFMSGEDLMTISGIDESLAQDIINACKRYICENKDKISVSAKQVKTEKKLVLSVADALNDITYRNDILRYTKTNNIAIKNLKLSTRSKKQLIANGYNYISDIIFMTQGDFDNTEKLSANSVTEICNVIRQYFDFHSERMLLYINGDKSALVDDKTIRSLVLDIYHEMKFEGLDINDLSEKIRVSVDVPLDRLKIVLDKLVADGILKYANYRYYKTYPRFVDYYVNSNIDERSKEIIKSRLAGQTLDEIGTELSITRERVRQILIRSVKNIYKQYIHKTNNTVFGEDYYRYLYETYEFDQKEISSWLGVTDEVWIYLETTGAKQGTLQLEAMIKDVKNLDAGLRSRIKNYINQSRIYIDGKWIEKRRVNFESVVIKKFCKDETKFVDFVEIFNNFLISEGIPYDEKLYYTDEILASRKNRIQDSRFVLWKLGEKFRYYDIDGQDFTEMFEVLDLDSYKNVEISTAKFVEEYPELMEKFDIKDGYELHNLLRKILENDTYGTYPELKFTKMPTIRFGTPDRDSDMFDMMAENAPISMSDLCKLIHKEYGYDIKMIPNYLKHIMDYYHDGVFKVDYKSMSEDNQKLLMANFGQVQ